MVESRNRDLGLESSSVKEVDIDHHSAVVRGLNGFVEKRLHLLPPPDRLWQPSDLLPDLSQEGWQEEVQNLKGQAENLSDDLLVVLAGATITEDALPTYQTWLNRFPAIRDKTGTDNAPWAQWIRGWTADERRHGDVLNYYMRLSGRFNMLTVEQTTQNLIKSGFNPQIGDDPYKGLVYVSFQEQATHISHRNAGQIAKQQGDETLAKVFTKVSGDEARHMAFYQQVTGEVFRIDPNDAVIAARDVLRQGIKIPGMLMTQDGILPSSSKPTPLYQQLSNASIRCEAYTPLDYVNIFKNLMEEWNIKNLSVSADGAQAQEDLGRMLRLYERVPERSTPKQVTTTANGIHPWLK